jgi:sialic acid synthase SpsE
MRRSLVARRTIARGEKITEAMLTCRRPATGLSPALVELIAGRIAADEIPAGAPLAWAMLK